MMKSKNNKINLVWVIALLLIVLNCRVFEKTSDLNGEFNLKKDEIARINQTNLRVKMLGAGHEITESSENAYCKIE